MTKSVTDTEGIFTEFNDLDYPTEYAVYGWARWASTASKGPWHNLYMFTPHSAENSGDLSKPGDRTLVCWVGAGFLYFSTSSFDYYGAHTNDLH